MRFVDRFKALFRGKKEEPTVYEALERQVEALEGRLIITEHAKRIEGGTEAFEMAFDEAQQMLTAYGGEGPAHEALEQLRRRMDLARQAAYLLREADPAKKKQMCQKFVADFHQIRDHLHYRTKSKYERIRIDFQSGRLR